MMFPKNRLQASASVIIVNGEYAFEGTPKLVEIESALQEICRDKQIYCTISPARSQGYPAILVYADSPTFSGNGTHRLKEAWKSAVRQALQSITKIVADGADTVVTFSDGTSCSTD